jgi:hypothetical protein
LVLSAAPTAKALASTIRAVPIWIVFYCREVDVVKIFETKRAKFAATGYL